MKYYFKNTVEKDFDDTVNRVTEELKKEGFGVLTEINVKNTLKEKLDVGFRNYVILGACNPPFAYKALQADDKIGMLLPCNVIVQELEDGLTEVAAIDPATSMSMIENAELAEIADRVGEKLKSVVDRL
ncbi:MAG: DUF302 domain-containing protein [FCB group bacterium]|nr:DUF302 domain-containing protein [FCB group bacterium]